MILVIIWSCDFIGENRSSYIIILQIFVVIAIVIVEI